jgi:hypothetical protein
MSEQNDNPTEVPDDFPHRPAMTSLPGTQLKVSVTKFEGRYYAVGNSPPERLERYCYCLGLASWFAEKCVRNEHGKYEGLTRAQIIEQYHTRLQAMRNVQFHDLSEAEVTWIMCRCAEILGWPFQSKDGRTT